eukprot:c27977_g1_i2 orf=497-1504(-)
MATTTNVVSFSSACYSCHPVALIRVERLAYSAYRSSTKVKLSWQNKSRIYQHISCHSLPCDWRGNGTFTSQKHCHLFHAFTLQAVTAENDFKSSDVPGSSSMESAYTWSGGEGSKQSLFQSLQFLQMWLRSITKDGIVDSVSKGLGETKGALLNLDAKQVDTVLKSRKLNSYVAEWSRNTPPWIKWPFAIFVPWYFVVSMAYGFSVSSDLLPLWAFGPLGAAFAIKALLHLSAFCRWLAMYTVSTKPVAGFIQLYEVARSGQLPQRINGLGQLAEKKKSEVVLYVESGQLVADLKQLFGQKLLELRSWSVEKYEDTRQRLRLFWVTLSRTLQRIF